MTTPSQIPVVHGCDAPTPAHGAPGVNRRVLMNMLVSSSALTIGASVLAEKAAVAAPVVVDAADLPIADARLIELDRHHADLVAAQQRAEDSFRAAESAVRRAVGLEPIYLKSQTRSQRVREHQLRAYEEARVAYRARKLQAEVDLRLTEVSAAYSDAHVAVMLMESEVWETPAVGLEGFRAKARMAKRSGSSLAYSILQDLLLESSRG